MTNQLRFRNVLRIWQPTVASGADLLTHFAIPEVKTVAITSCTIILRRQNSVAHGAAPEKKVITKSTAIALSE